jgi:hypothetical protein
MGGAANREEERMDAFTPFELVRTLIRLIRLSCVMGRREEGRRGMPDLLPG